MDKLTSKNVKESNKRTRQQGSFKTAKGITLIALVITIIILLILAAVAIGTLTGDNGLIKRAQDAKNKTLEAGNLENATFGELENLIDTSTGTTNGGNGGTPAGAVDATSKVGYYAKIGDEYGVIFADLAVGGSGTWNPSNDSGYNLYGAYTIPTETGLKSYVISEETHTEKGYGTHPVLKAADGTTGNDRFYVMALSDIGSSTYYSSTYYWYDAAYRNDISDYSTVTSQDFGTGKTNTATMISKWDSAEYGDQSTDDMWGQIKTKVANGWFVPSRAEWAAFGAALNIDKSNYSDTFGLSNYYWSSSLSSSNFACYAYFINGYMLNNTISSNNYVRLATTF